MNLRSYVAKRILQAIPTIFAILVINFVIIHSVPGDPVHMLIGEFQTDETYVQLMRAKFGLDKPLQEQLFLYLVNTLQGDLGTSVSGKPVIVAIVERIPNTLLLMSTGMFFGILFGILAGVISSKKVHSLVDNITTVGTLMVYSMPAFWLAQMLVLFFAIYLHWLPSVGMITLRVDLTGIDYVIDLAKHLILPAMALGVGQLALMMRLTRSGMLRVMKEDYIITAKAKGLPENTVIYKHAFRNALLPLITMIGHQIGFMITGAVLTEAVFSWPGMGRLLTTALQSRDYPVIMGILLVVSVTVVISNLVTDVLYASLDPRVKYQ